MTRAVTKPWQMYPVGLLFGLGFDTATEVSLLVLAGGAAAFALPWYAILTLPILFAAGMSLLDTIDGCFMNFAYGWAFSKPVRKVYYNITITGLSVAVALVIGTIELVSILADQLGITSGPLAAVGRPRPQRRRLRDRRAVRRSPGSWPSRCGASPRIEEKWTRRPAGLSVARAADRPGRHDAAGPGGPPGPVASAPIGRWSAAACPGHPRRCRGAPARASRPARVQPSSPRARSAPTVSEFCRNRPTASAASRC